MARMGMRPRVNSRLSFEKRAEHLLGERELERRRLAHELGHAGALLLRRHAVNTVRLGIRPTAGRS